MRIAVAPSLTFTYTQASPKGALLNSDLGEPPESVLAGRLASTPAALGLPTVSGRGLQGPRVATLLGLQGALGNRGVQRYLQRAEAPNGRARAGGLPVSGSD